MIRPANLYCDKLGVNIPRVEDYTRRKGVKLIQLMILALLERGEPMEIEEIASRLAAAGVTVWTGDLAHSLQKAWHGHEALYRDSQGRFALNLSSRRLRWALQELGLSKPAPFNPPYRGVPTRPESDPLAIEEVKAALGRGLKGMTMIRTAAAVLDAHKRPMTIEEITAFLGTLGWRAFITADEARRQWKTGLVSFDDAGRLVLDPATPDLGAMRSHIRKLARPELDRRAIREYAERTHAIETEREARDREKARTLRRAIIRVVPDPDFPRAIGILDVGARTIRTFMGPEELVEAHRNLGSFDVAAGLEIRRVFEVLGLPDDCVHLVDLGPPRKSRQLNRQGRRLHITLGLILRGTLGSSRGFSGRSKVGRYLEEGSRGRLERRLESELKTLCALYQYGVLHNAVRLRWGFLDEPIHVEWAEPGDPHLYDILREAQGAGKPVDLVLGWAPGWEEPWGRARRFDVLQIGYWDVRVKGASGEEILSNFDIQAARIVEPEGPPSS